MLKNHRFICCQILLMLLLSLFVFSAYAAETKMTPAQISYEAVEEEEFSLDSSSSVSTFSYGEKSIGSFSISGADIRNTTYQGIDAYIGTGTISFNYSYEGTHQTKDDETWNLVSSGKKKVGEIEVKKQIKKGVAIVQRSEDGRNWTNVVDPQTNLFDKYSEEKGLLYSVDESDLKQGVFYRVLVAYEMTHKTGKASLVNVPVISNIQVDQFENRTFVEEYRFYLAYGQNPVIIRDLLSRSAVSTGATVSDGFIIDKNGASDTVKVAKDGGTSKEVEDGAAFYEAGRYFIDIESKIGSKYQYTINVSEGTRLQPVVSQVYENTKNDKYTEDNPVSEMPKTGLSSYSELMIGQRGNAGFSQGKVQNVNGYGTNSDRVEIFLQLNNADKLTANGWFIEADDWGEKEKQKIGDSYTGVVGTGAVIVQTSLDGITWTDIDRGRYAEGLFTTDVAANYEGRGPIHVYSPAGEDILKGLYVRVFYAYRARNKEEKLDNRYIEKYEFYLCSSNLDAVTFHNLSAEEKLENAYGDNNEETVDVYKRTETMLSGAGTVTGFTIDTSLNPAASYEVFRDGTKIGSFAGQKYTTNGRYEIRLKSPVGDNRTVTLYVDSSEDEDALKTYFGDSFISGKRIFSEGTYPVYEGGKTSYNISAISDNLLPVSGTIRNTTTGKEIKINASRSGQRGDLKEAGDYIAVFSTNGNYDADEKSGDNRIFTFRFSLIQEGTAPGPQVNRDSLYRYAQSKVSDSYPIYYGLTYQSARKGYITLAFSTEEDAISYQRNFEKGMVEQQPDGTYLYTGSFVVSQKERYDSKWDLADAIDYYAKQAVSRLYFDISDEATYLTLTDDVLEANKNLRTLELERSIVIFADGEREKLTALKDALPIINDKPYATIMPGAGRQSRTGFEGFQFVRDKYQCDSFSVQITDCEGKTFCIEYGKDVGAQLKAGGCATGVVTITEKNIYGDQNEYQAVFVNDGDITASVDIDCYVDGKKSKTVSVTKESADTVIEAEAFSISAVKDALDPYDLILIKTPDHSTAYYAADQLIPDVWSKPGEYSIKVVNRLGHCFSFQVSVDESEFITIAFRGEGTEDISDLLVKQGQVDLELPVPERYGYDFAGYVDSDGNVYQNSISTVTFEESVVLESIWKAKQYTILFKDPDGKVISSRKVDFGKEIVLPVPDTDDENEFTGWQEEGRTLEDNKYRLTKENDVVLTAVQRVKVTEETETESAEEDRSDDEKKGSKRNVSGWIFIMLLMVAGGIYVAYRVKGSNNSFKKLISEKKDGLINKGDQRKQAARDNVDGGLEAGSDEENEEDIK